MPLIRAQQLADNRYMVYEEITDPFRRFVRIMERLQEPGGCPWDLEQTHESLRPYFIEETYEAIDAIDRQDWVALKEELGDVLLQVVFHSILAARTGKFKMDEVIEGASKKMIHRHPHVFGEVEAKTAEDVLRNWEGYKQTERAQKAENNPATDGPPESLLAHVPKGLPALLRAQRLQEKAARVGFDWPDALQVLDKVEEEIGELRAAMKAGDAVHSAEEMGDVLFSLVNLARFMKTDAETALSDTCEKFRFRFQHIEARAHEQGKQLKDMTLEEMDKFWNEAKGR